jgi:hypothetical protein
VIFRTLDDGRYSAAFADHGVEFYTDRLRRDRNQEIVGELTVTCGILGSRAIDGPLTAGTFNFSNLRQRDEWARRLGQRARTGNKIDWFGFLEAVCQRVQAAERDDQAPAIRLREVPLRTAEQEFEVLGLTFPRAHATIPFGDGGACKSLLALRAASELAADGTRVAFFDWELDKFVHRRRLQSINGPDMPDVIYVRCDRPLVYEQDRLKRIIRSERIEFGFFDSIGFGTDGPPEAAEHAMSYFRAIRQLGVGAWLIAHVSKAETGDQRPFGSVFWHNSARSTWNIKLASTSADGNTLSLGAFHRKSNLGRLHPAQGVSVQFDGDRVYFTRTDIASIDEFAEALPLWQRLITAVKHQPQTLAALSEDLGAKVETIDRTVRRKRELFTRITGPDGVHRIALIERRAS